MLCISTIQGWDDYLFGHGVEAVGKDMLPDALHVRPVGDNAMLQGVFEPQQASVLLHPGPDKAVAFQCAGHDTRVFWSANASTKEALWLIFTGKAGLDGARALAGALVGMARRRTLSIQMG